VPGRILTLSDLTERVYMDILTRPTQTSLYRCPHPTPSNDSPKQVYTDTLKRPAQTTYSNELTWTPSNDLPEQVYMGAHRTKMKGQGRARKTSCMNVHKSHPRSQLSIFDMGLCAWACPHTEKLDKMSLHGCPRLRCLNVFTETPSLDPPKRFYMDTIT